MSVADLYWVETPAAGRLAVAPRPRAGDWLEDEIQSWRAAGVACVASLLEEDEIEELGLQEEPVHCATNAMQFILFPIRDRGVPALEQADDFVVRLANDLSRGKNVLIHCRAGIGRAGTMAACVLVWLGLPPDDAIARISAARRTEIPDTDEQRSWIVGFARSRR